MIIGKVKLCKKPGLPLYEVCETIKLFRLEILHATED